VRISLVSHRVGAMLALAVVAGLVSAGTSAAATAQQPPDTSFAVTAKQLLPQFPLCSWWFETTPQSANVALPDSSAAYWTTPFFASPGLKIYVKGQFPDARFMSVTVYNNSGGTFTSNGVSSGLVDYQITPDQGTGNPFQQAGATPGQFTLTIQRQVSPSQDNALPLVPATSAKGTILPPGFGFITYRVYLPHSGSFGTVPLPTLVFSRPGSTQTLQTCSGNNPVEEKLAQLLKLDIKKRAFGGITFPAVSGFERPPAADTNLLFPNVASAYLAATFAPTPGTVVVVRAKAPTFTPDSSAQPWPNPAYDLRYWSLCNNEDTSPYPVVDVTDPQTGAEIFGCSADLNTPVVNGYYTYVLSSLADRPPNATTADGVAWLPYSADQVEQVLLLRNMLTNDTFANSVQQVPQDSNPASAQQVMGAYYPRFAQCSVSTFTQGGPTACFAAAGS
jgi:hypothetical protein